MADRVAAVKLADLPAARARAAHPAQLLAAVVSVATSVLPMAAKAAAVKLADLPAEQVQAVLPAHPQVERVLAVLLVHPAVERAPAETLDRLTAARGVAEQPAQALEAVRMQAVQAGAVVLYWATTITLEYPQFHLHLQQSAATMPVRPGEMQVLEARLMGHPEPARVVEEQVRRVVLSQPEQRQEGLRAVIQPVLARARLARARPVAVMEQRVAALRVQGKVLQVAA